MEELVTAVGVGGRRPKPFGPCRVCGDDAFAKDSRGPVHACCQRLPEGATSCESCVYAAQARKKGVWRRPEVEKAPEKPGPTYPIGTCGCGRPSVRLTGGLCFWCNEAFSED